MAKQPYIPLYIGDWEQDVNGLSIEAEGAWLKIIFKCWRNQGSFTATIDILSRVCKVTPQKFVDILLEWELGNICEITRHENGLITLASRRILRDCEISKERQIAGQKSAAKRQQTVNKPPTNGQQIPEYDNDIDIEVKGIKEEVQEKPLKGWEECPILSDGSLAEVFDQGYMAPLPIAFRGIDIAEQFLKFKIKIRGAPEEYGNRDAAGLRNAFLYQLRKERPETNGKQAPKDKSTEHLSSLVQGYKRRNNRTS